MLQIPFQSNSQQAGVIIITYCVALGRLTLGREREKNTHLSIPGGLNLGMGDLQY